MGFLKKLALIWHFSLQYLAFDPRENLATLLELEVVIEPEAVVAVDVAMRV